MEQSWKRTPVRPCLAHSPASGSCVRLLKQLAAFKTPSGVNNFGFHSFFFLIATHPRLGDVHRNRTTLLPTSSAYWISMQREGRQCPSKDSGNEDCC